MKTTTRSSGAMHLDDSSCADLVLELLSEPEREAALAHATACPECEARLRAHVAATDRARADWRERAGTRGRVSALPRARLSPAQSRGWMLALAAALTVAVALPLILSRNLERGPAHWLPELGEQVRTRGGETEDPHLTTGLEAYRTHDLSLANRELTLARAEGSSEQLRRLYLANVRDQLGDPRSALDLLRSLQWRNLPEPWRHDGVVLFARVLRASGQAASADSIENALRSLPPGTPYIP